MMCILDFIVECRVLENGIGKISYVKNSRWNNLINIPSIYLDSIRIPLTSSPFSPHYPHRTHSSLYFEL
jgi:hypothetical protein